MKWAKEAGVGPFKKPTTVKNINGSDHGMNDIAIRTFIIFNRSY